MMRVTAISLSFAICLVSAGQKKKDLILSPVNLDLVIGETMDINCTICPKLRGHYNSSHIAFNFTIKRANEPLGSLSTEEEHCNEKSDLTTEENFETDNATDTCNATQDEEDDFDDVFLDPDVITFQLPAKYIRIVNRFRAELRYPSVNESFNNGNLACYLRPDPRIREDSHALVGERPRMPVITDVTVRNLRQIEFSWKTIGVTKTYTTNYQAWYRNRTSKEFIECPLQPKTTPPPGFSEALGLWKRCLTFCVADVGLSFLRDPMTSVFVLKVTGSNLVGNVTSEEKIVDLRDILIPNPVLDLSVRVTNLSICVLFRSPQPDATLDYEILFNCNSKIYETMLSALKLDFVDQCISSLPSYSVCVVSIRAKPHGFGNWSERSGPNEFQTPERVPLAAPEVCRSCFEVSPSNKSGNLLVKIFFKPLPHELARGRIAKYHLLVRGYNFKSMVFESHSLPLAVDGLNSSSSIYNFYLTVSTTVGYNKSVIPQPLTLNPFLSYELKHIIRNVTAFILNGTTVQLSWSCLEPTDGKNFSVFWCRGEAVCKSEIHSLRVPPGASQQAITIVPNMELINFLYGVAFETRDGQSSGISWSQCLHNLSQVCSPPKLGKELIGESLRLKFYLDNICNGGYPYAFNVSYCSLEANDENRNCRGAPVVIVVNSSDRVYEIGHLPSPDKHYLFMASSLTVAGPSLNPSEMILHPSINPPSDDKKRILLVMLFAVPLICGAVYFLVRHLKRRFTHVPIAFPPVIEVEPMHSTQDEFDQILPYTGCSVPVVTISSSSGNSSTGSLVRNDDTVSSMHPLLVDHRGYRNPVSSTGSDPYRPGDSESCDGSGGNGVGDSAGSAGSDYRAVGSLTIKIPDQVMMSPPVTDLKIVEDLTPECESEVGSESDRDQRTFGNTDSGYAFGRLADRSQSGSRHSLEGSSGLNDSAELNVEMQSLPNSAVIFLPVSNGDGEIDNTIIIRETNLNDSDEDGDDDDDDDDEDDDDPYQCSSGGYATTRLRDKEAEPFLDTVAAKPIYSPDSSSDGDDDDDNSSSSCPYAAVTFSDKPDLNSSADLPEILNSS